MRTIRCLSALVALTSLGVSVFGPSSPSTPVRAFVGAAVIDGTGRLAFQKAVIVVRQGRIEAVGPSGESLGGARTCFLAEQLRTTSQGRKSGGAC